MPRRKPWERTADAGNARTPGGWHPAVGNRIVYKGEQHGAVRYVGPLPGAKRKGDYVGVELDEPKGKNNGRYKAKEYFQCDRNHGIFTPPANLTKELVDPAQLAAAGVEPELGAQLLATVATDTAVVLDDVVGLDGAKQALWEAVVEPALNPDLFRGLLAPAKGLLLFGPPGNGKTFIAKAIASETGATFFNISVSSVMSSAVGEAQKLVRALFVLARLCQPTIVFVDEVDSIMSVRGSSSHESANQMKTEFLIGMEGMSTRVNERVLVMAATNLPWQLDSAFMSRITKRVYIAMPSAEARAQLVQKMVRKVDHQMGASELSTVATSTAGYSNSDLSNLVRDAAFGPIREQLAKANAVAVRVTVDDPGGGGDGSGEAFGGGGDGSASLGGGGGGGGGIRAPRQRSRSHSPRPLRRSAPAAHRLRASSPEPRGHSRRPRGKTGRRRSDAAGTSVGPGGRDPAKIKGVEEKHAAVILKTLVGADAPGVSMDSVIGLAAAKAALIEAVVLPTRQPTLFQGLRSPAKGLLLFGPPGNGKTMIARATASETCAAFFSVTAATLMDKYFGESTKLVRALFTIARSMQPSIIFIDEVDSIVSKRREGGGGSSEGANRMKNEFLAAFDGVGTAADDRVLVMAATNLPDQLDSAAMRRFPTRIYVPLPDPPARKALILMMLQGLDYELGDRDLDRLVAETDGYANRNLSMLVKDAAKGPLRRARGQGMDIASLTPDMLPRLTLGDFLVSLRTVRPAYGKESVAAVEAWAREHGAAAVPSGAEAGPGPGPAAGVPYIDPDALRPVMACDFAAALQKIRPSYSDDVAGRYLAWAEQWGM